MKIGILTFHNSNNYGAVLQTTALYKKVKSINSDVEVIDYICPNKVQTYKSLDIGKHKSLVKNIYAFLQFPVRKYKNNIFANEISQMYKISNNKYENNQDISKDYKKWDKVICGSDQIWNHDNTKFDTTYLLDFIKEDNKKISYAASFGLSDIDDKYKAKYTELLNKIENLSVREVRGKEIVKELTNRDSQVVLDPTLLLNKEEWIEFAQSIPQNEKYVLIYTLGRNKEVDKQAEIISKKLGCKVVKIATDALDFVSKYKCVIPNPQQYVDLINNAACVVTDSFHGTIFSVNLNVPFYTVLKSTNKRNSRITGILDIVGLSDRVIYDRAKDIEITSINYLEVNKKLDNERLKSINFLTNSLNNFINDKDMVINEV